MPHSYAREATFGFTLDLGADRSEIGTYQSVDPCSYGVKIDGLSQPAFSTPLQTRETRYTRAVPPELYHFLQR